MNTDVLIVGSGCSGLYCALKLPRDVRIILITKSDLESNDSYLAQGGMCMLKEQSDFDSFFEDTLKAGHYENDRESVGIMINSSPEVVKDLVSYGADFARNDDGSLAYTREGAHSHNRIIFHEDVTGKEITSTLLAQVKKLSNVTLMEYTTMVDIIERDNKCYGAIIRKQAGIYAGKEGYDIQVKNNTHLKGAVIDSKAPAEKNKLTTGTLTWENMDNKTEYKAKASGITASTNAVSKLTPLGLGYVSTVLVKGKSESTTLDGT